MSHSLVFGFTAAGGRRVRNFQFDVRWSTEPADRGAGLMPRIAPTRPLTVLALVVAGVLGTAYTLGRAVTSTHQSRGTAAADAASTPQTTGRPADRKPHPAEPPPPGSAPTPFPADDRPQLPLEQGGPYGSRMTTGSSDVALTFDDGPDPRWTPQVLALLQRYDVRATFCVVGQNAQRYPELVQAIVAAGHTLCNHSWSHDLALGSRSRGQIEADLTRTSLAIRAAVPEARIAYFRQPGGNWTAGVVEVASRLGMTPLHWAVDPQDWKMPGSASIVATVTSRTVAGSIVLLHDAGGNRQGTVNALGAILADLTRRYQLAALPPGNT